MTELSSTLSTLKSMNHSDSTHSHKGTGVINVRKFVDMHCGDGIFDSWAKIYDPSWSSIIIPTGWYNMDMVIFIVDKFSSFVNQSFEESAKEIGKFSISNDIKSVYKVFVSSQDPVRVLEMFPLMGARYHNFLTITPVQNSKGIYVCDFKLPSIYKKWNIGVVRGRVEGLLESCSAFVTQYENSVLANQTIQTDLITIRHSFKYQKTQIGSI